MDKRRQANKAKQAEAQVQEYARRGRHRQAHEMWTEKVKKMEVEWEQGGEQGSLVRYEQANYMDPRITVAWCKRCDLGSRSSSQERGRTSARWAMGVDGDWRFEAELKSK